MGISWYNLAALSAVRGRRDEALDRLRRATENGYTDVRSWMKDSQLESLHGDPEFEAIVAEAKQRIGRKR